MYVGSPLLPIKIEGKAVAEAISTTLEEKNWHKFELATLKLTLVPYFLFNYHYYNEKNGESEAIIESSKDGVLALNGSSMNIEEGADELIREALKDAGNEAPQIEFEEKKTSIDKREQDEVLQFKTAEFFKVPKKNVVISSAKKILVPYYETFVEVEEGTFDIKINAIDGKIHGIEKVPEREKGFLEVTEETLDDLKDPKMWVEYTKGLFTETGKMVANKKTIVLDKGQASSGRGETGPGLDSSFLTSKWLLIIIIVIALFLIWIGIQAL